MWVLLLGGVSGALGLYLGRRRASNTIAMVVAVVLLAASNLLASWAWFVTDEPASWLRTYLTGLAHTGVLSLLIHVAPFAVALLLARRLFAVDPHAA